MLRVRITVENKVHVRDVITIRFETRCPLRTKPGEEIQYLRACDEDGPKWPIETQRLFVAEIPAGAETKERKAPPVSSCPEPKDPVGLLFPCF